jgi:hypothetical protein
MGSSAKTPAPITPGQAAQAAVGTAAAGEMMSVANQPVDQYGNLMTTEALGPAEMQTQQALANRAAMQGAQAQQNIQATVDPQAYAQRQMRMNAANKTLGRLYGVDPTAFGYSAPSAYAVPGSADSPDLASLKANASAIASQLSTAGVNSAGGNPQLNKPNKPITTLPSPTVSQSYLG